MTIEMPKCFFVCVVSLCLFAIVSAQSTQEPQTLTPDTPVERELAGGESHAYQVKLTAGQFIRVVVEQKGIDLTIAFVAPDGKQVVETDRSSITFYGTFPTVTSIIFAQQSLSHEAETTGEYRIVIRAVTNIAPKGTYELRLELKAAVTAQDKKRMDAER